MKKCVSALNNNIKSCKNMFKCLLSGCYNLNHSQTCENIQKYVKKSASMSRHGPMHKPVKTVQNIIETSKIVRKYVKI